MEKKYISKINIPISGTATDLYVRDDRFSDNDLIKKYVETTYSNLVTLRNNSNLIPGQFYRIIDY